MLLVLLPHGTREQRHSESMKCATFKAASTSFLSRAPPSFSSASPVRGRIFVEQSFH
jgi:hypothetical protein